jgi:phosphatidylglycerophosphate synthase
MNTHRTNKVPDWQEVPLDQRNMWQNVAASTEGFITPGNIITVLGAKFVFSGLLDIRKGQKLRGVVNISIGRVADIADGYVADKSRTKSPKGEAFDAGIDALEMGVALPVLVSEDILPARTAAAYFVQKAANTFSTVLAKKRGNEIHPSLAGKLTAVAQWSTIALYGLAAATRDSEYTLATDVLEEGAFAAEVLSLALGATASIGYLKDAFR